MNNLFAPLPETPSGEAFDELCRGGEFCLERIVSRGHVTPPGQWYDQDRDEWVVLLAGGAVLQFDDGAADVRLAPGDFLHIAAHRRHRVEWTTPDEPTVWLALHFQSVAPGQQA